jgi:hypothetical protein
LSAELFGPKWLKDLPRTEQGHAFKGAQREPARGARCHRRMAGSDGAGIASPGRLGRRACESL